MTFNVNSKRNNNLYSSTKFGSDSNDSSPDNDASKLINELQVLFLDFDKAFVSLKDYNKKLDSLTETEYIKRSQTMHSTIESVHNNLKEINKIMIKFESINIEDPTLKSKSIESMRMVNNKIRPKQEELSNLINDITKKEKAKNDHLVMSLKSRQNSTLNNPKSGPSNGSYGNKFSSNSNEVNNNNLNNNNSQKQILEIYNEPLIDYKDIAFLEQINKERETDLKHIQVVSGQIKEMSLFMNEKVKSQGNLLSK